MQFRRVITVLVMLNIMVCAQGEIVPFWDTPFQRLGSQGSLAPSSLKGSLIIVEFWASWCVPCRKTLPAIDSLSNDSVGVYAISLDESKEVAASFYKASGPNTELVHDPAKKSGKMVALEGLPTLFIVNAEGVIVRRWDGFGLADKKYIVEMIEKELEDIGGDIPLPE
jgi:thiol-disulfide isomerase/thioredoxin